MTVLTALTALTTVLLASVPLLSPREVVYRLANSLAWQPHSHEGCHPLTVSARRSISEGRDHRFLTTIAYMVDGEEGRVRRWLDLRAKEHLLTPEIKWANDDMTAWRDYTSRGTPGMLYQLVIAPETTFETPATLICVNLYVRR